MNALGSSSKWPSYDSLTSCSSFIVSESEHTEDEADVFSEGEGYSGTRKSPSGERITLSGNYLRFPAHSDRLHSRSKINQPECCPDKTKHLNQTSSPGAARLGSPSATPGDLAFAQKCADLQKFIRPLLELLHGLKTGRFHKGLSTFQQSVAMDRLQRILGVLQRPEMGEKYLQTLLQIEMLLKIWFPQVAFQSKDVPSQTTTPRLQPHWRQNQLHMPVKKRKLSWSDPDNSCKVLTTHEHHQHGSCQAATPLNSISMCLPGSPKRQRSPEEETVEAAEDVFTYSAGTLSKPLYSCSKREKSEISLASPCKSPATQDTSVSSSDIITTTESP
ncbi:circadian associated repressor of transcription a [Epinephelus lanceolatus]|uniref:circadian associated repressor of transcription a n=1 Tax=Epinephelus lanceolatus TaxID=310571 RepID=UPI001446322E|nr:circadian associated repressor of transcription a [Epinephelus lanceolatus]